jgi:hypothetical protein
VNGQRWRLTPEEVQVIWPLTGVSRLPFPFDVRPTAATVDEQRAVDAAARARLATGHVLAGGRLDPDLHSALLVLARPRAALDAVGFVGDRPSDLVRILAARSGTSGVLAVQLPGLAEDAGGDLLVETVPAAGLPAALVRALPPAPPGRSGAVRVTPQDTAPDESGSVLRSVRPHASQLAVQQLTQLTTGRMDGADQIAASVVAPGGADRRECRVRWFDRPGDGRYLLRHDADVTAQPASSTEIVEAARQQLEGLLRTV